MRLALGVFVAATTLAQLPAPAAAQRASKDDVLSNWISTPSRNHNAACQRRYAIPQHFSATLAPAQGNWTTPGQSQLRVAGRVPARVSWSATDITLAGAFTAALLIDAGQTRALARDGWQGWRETNPILGPRPSVGRINTYTAATGLTVLGTAAFLPSRVRTWFLWGAFAVEAFTVTGSARQGLAIRIP